MRVATYFSGGGLKTIGAMQAGFKPILAVEWNGNPKIGAEDVIAQVYGDNIAPEHLLCCPVQKVPISYLLGLRNWLDLFMFSPPCIRASAANSKQGESELDIELAEAICRAIRVVRPRAVMVENVIGYRKFKAFKMITDTLDKLGYTWQADNLNSADFGVPQTRRRLILRAVREGILLPLLPTHSKGGINSLKPWIGWYEAIEDLLPDCPESALAPWQLRRLPEELRTLLIGAGGYDGTVVQASPKDSVFCLTANQNQANQLRAILVEGDAAGERPPATLSPEIPAFTIKTPSGGRVHRAILSASSVRVVALTLRCLARFQTMPDWYRFPAKKSLGCVVAGNGIPCLFSQRIVENLRDSLIASGYSK